MPADRSFPRLPAVPPPPDAPTDPEPADTRPNRAARRGGRSGADPAPAPGRGTAPRSRGVQGRRVNPVRRTG